jgi:predicted metal-dependent peptidase
MTSHGFREVKLTYDQKQAVDIASVAFMNEAPFYAHIFYSIGRLVPTLDIPTAATDGRHVVINPEYFCKHKVSEQVFILCHELAHLVGRHAQRFKHYEKQDSCMGLPWDHEHANRCADYVINADLVDTKVGSCNPDWLYDPKIKASELWEDVYKRTYQNTRGGQPPKPPGTGNPGGSPGTGQSTPKAGGKSGDGPEGPSGPGRPKGVGAGQSPPSKTFSQSEKAIRGAKGDGTVGSFDQILEPPTDPATGAPDLPDESEFREAIARAAAAAKSMGKLPGNIQRMVDELLTPQVDWRDHIRMLVTGKIGARRETWARPDRRRLALNPIVVMPGRRGFGAECVVVAVDTSGSIGATELQAFFTEIGGVLNDCKPKRIFVIGCDTRVTQVDEVSTLDEFEGMRAKGIKGGGGTRFEPVFDYVEKHNLRPETLIYMTDMMGSFPTEAPRYPTIWAATTDHEGPWGETVRIKL